MASMLVLFGTFATPNSASAQNIFDKINQSFGDYIVTPFGKFLLFDLVFWDNANPHPVTLPFIVAWLILGALFFTLRFNFINLRAFAHAVRVVSGRYDKDNNKNDGDSDGDKETQQVTGEVSHFQALSSALSATVGLGNIAGVAIAVHLGGPGAVVWMVLAGFLGMSSKFTECTLGQMYRTVEADGHVLGGPMRYLDHGLAELGWPKLGKVLAVVFAVLCIGGSLGGGNMFQANQSYAQVQAVVPFFAGGSGSVYYGLFLAALVGVVIIGGIRRIGQVASLIVPLMCGLYLLAGVFVIGANFSHIGSAFQTIFDGAFSMKAGLGGFFGVLVVGFQRAAFSNEAGIGSASIAHSAAATDEPVREGLVALLEPFIDTMVVCTMTGLVVVITGAYHGEEEGVMLTSHAFATVLPWFPYVLSFAVFLFAFSTLVSWSYYGDRAFTFLFGHKASMVYRVIFLGFIVLGAVLNLKNVIGFSDLMILGMALPNILGLLFLNSKVKDALSDYSKRFKL